MGKKRKGVYQITKTIENLDIKQPEGDEKLLNAIDDGNYEKAIEIIEDIGCTEDEYKYALKKERQGISCFMYQVLYPDKRQNRFLRHWSDEQYNDDTSDSS